MCVCALNRWVPLLQLLHEKLHGRLPTEEEVMQYDQDKVQELINSDPVTCARAFDLDVQHLFNHSLSSPHSPLGKLTDFFYRVEFQKRGKRTIIFWHDGFYYRGYYR